MAHLLAFLTMVPKAKLFSLSFLPLRKLTNKCNHATPFLSRSETDRSRRSQESVLMVGPNYRCVTAALSRLLLPRYPGSSCTTQLNGSTECFVRSRGYML